VGTVPRRKGKRGYRMMVSVRRWMVEVTGSVDRRKYESGRKPLSLKT